MCSSPAFSQQPLTTYQTTFWEIALPQTFPVRLTLRKIFPSTAVITRADVALAHGSRQIGAGSKIYSYSYLITDDDRFPQAFELAPNESRKTQIAFELPAGHYQFFAGYGGGVHESKSIVSNPVSLDLWKDQGFPETE